MEEKLVALLLDKKYTITTVESCTGGMVAAKIINVSGASEVFEAGVITYANWAKEKFADVPSETLEKYGAVSYQTAGQMAEGGAKKAGANVAIAVTGIAGPGGGTSEKPVGLVYLGCYISGKVFTKECHFEGDRLSIRQQSAKEAISFAYDMLKSM